MHALVTLPNSFYACYIFARILLHFLLFILNF